MINYLKTLTSWKKHPGFLILIVLSMMGYGNYLAFHFLVTPSRFFSFYFASVFLILTLLFLYYVAYRWVDSSLTQTRFHHRLMLMLSTILISTGIGIWFVQSTEITIALFNLFARWVPESLWNAQRAHGLLPYSPFILLAIIVLGLGGLLFFIMSRVKKLDIIRIRHYSYLFFILSVTTCIFVTDFLEIPPGEQSVIYWGGTEDYIRYRIRDVELDFIQDIKEHGGFIYGHGPNTTDPVRDYLSETGFYGSILKLIQTTTKIDPEKIIVGSRLLFGFLTALIFTSISIKVKKGFGILPSIIFSTLCATTYWFIGPSTHLIWFFPVAFIPLLISMYLYPNVLNGKMTQKTFLWLIFTGQMLVFLRSYSYTPVMILMAAIPAFFYNLRAQKKFKEVLWNGVVICLIGILALATVMVIHTTQLTLYFDSVKTAVLYLADKTEERGATSIHHATSVQDVFRRWMNVKVFYISNRITSILPGSPERIKQWNRFKFLHLVMFAIVFLTGIAKLLQVRGLAFQKKFRNEIHTLFLVAVTTLAATISSWTWFPALGHMSAHYHMNGIMYMILMGLAVFLLLGVFFQTCVHLLVSINFKKNGMS